MEEALTNILSYIFHEISIATFVLFVALVIGIWVAHLMQKRSDFDFADMLRDDITLKPSGYRLATFVCLAFTSWLLVYTTIDAKYSESFVLSMAQTYLLVWSGVKVVEKLIDAWSGKRPGMPIMASSSTVTTSETSVITAATEYKPAALAEEQEPSEPKK